MVASSIGDSTQSTAKDVVKKAAIDIERPGSDRYQETHMAEIFQQGLSFSGFERNKVFFGRGDTKFLDLSDISGADSKGDCRAAVVADFDADIVAVE